MYVLSPNLPARFRAAILAEADWTAYRTKEDISTSNSAKQGEFTYQKKQERHVCRTFDCFKAYDHYLHSISVAHKLKSWNILTQVNEFFEARAAFLDVRIANARVIAVFHSVVCGLDKFGKTIDARILAIIAAELLKFGVSLDATTHRSQDGMEKSQTRTCP